MVVKGLWVRVCINNQFVNRLTKTYFVLYFNCQWTKIGSMPCNCLATASSILYPWQVIFQSR
jgi:hypothetical protein